MKNIKRKYLRRKIRCNKKVKSYPYDIRVVVTRSNKYMWANLVSQDGKVIKTFFDRGLEGKTKTDRAFSLGKLVGEYINKNYKGKKIVFDRNGFLYHGRVKAVAEGLREAGVSL